MQYFYYMSYAIFRYSSQCLELRLFGGFWLSDAG